MFLARLMAGQPDAKALQTTTAAVYEILARTAKRGGDELQLETDARSLSHPMAMVQFRHLTASRQGQAGLAMHLGTVVGVDGCPGGWIAVWRPEGGEPSARVFASFAELLDAFSR